jgi:hypothetical protein
MDEKSRIDARSNAGIEAASYNSASVDTSVDFAQRLCRVHRMMLEVTAHVCSWHLIYIEQSIESY